MKRGFFSVKREDLFKKWDKVGKQDRPDDQKFTSSDVFAMIIAVISIVLPWLLAIAGGVALVLFLIWKFYLKA